MLGIWDYEAKIITEVIVEGKQINSVQYRETREQHTVKDIKKSNIFKQGEEYRKAKNNIEIKPKNTIIFDLKCTATRFQKAQFAFK